MLLLKKHLVALVKAGVKRQTIRFWDRPRVRVGQRAYVPGLGRVAITAVEAVASVGRLTAADARADGFPTRAALLGELRALYGPGGPAGRTIYRVKFRWPADGPAAAGPAGGRAAGRARGEAAEAERRRVLRAYIVGRAPGRGG
jgi:hypothetical protein